MKIGYAFVLGSLVLFACSQPASQENADNDKEQKEEAHLPNVLPSHILSMDVAGMSCEMACGGSIREGLMETGAVARVQFDFEMGRDVNKAIISYDDSKISEKEMKEIVSKLNNNQFTVGECKDEVIESQETSSTSNEKSTSKETASVSMSSESFDLSLPNLSDLFQSIRL